MPSLADAVGYEYEPQPTAWNKRDLILYAVGIGAKKDDLQFVYELDKNFSAFPTYPVVLPFKLDNSDVVNFRNSVKRRGLIPGLPKLNPDRVVHGSQFVEMIKPLPLISGPGWSLKRRVVGVHENNKGIVLDEETILSDAQGEAYTRLLSSAFHLGAKSHPDARPSDTTITSAPLAKPIPKDRASNFVFVQDIPHEQAVLYRLSGDYNALHIDPSIGKASGFNGVILHGLCTFGFVARGILASFTHKDSNSAAPTLKAFGARFTSPVRPGDKLETSVWEVGPGPHGTVEVTFVTKNLTSGKICLGAGVAYVGRIEIRQENEKSKL